ncbi:MAG: hypothetical protein WCK96_19370 [Methylococcales bacterium]
MNNLFLTSKGSFGLSQWNQVVSSLITYGDSIYIPYKFFEETKIPLQVHPHFVKTYNELIEGKLLRYWGLEGRDKTNSSVSMISKESHKLIFEYLTEFDTNLRLPSNNGPELTSRYVDARADMYYMLVAQQCLRCSGIVDTKGKSELVRLHELYKQDVIQKNIVSKLFTKLGATNLYQLTAKDIIDLQNNAQFLRKELDQLMEGIILQPEPPRRITTDIVEKIHKKYTESIDSLIAEKSLKYISGESLLDAVFDITGHFIPGFGLFPIAAKFINNVNKRQESGLLVYINTLKNRAGTPRTA